MEKNVKAIVTIETIIGKPVDIVWQSWQLILDNIRQYSENLQ